MKIPFSKLTFDSKERKAVAACMKSGWVVLGPKTQEFEEQFARYVGAKYAVFVDSGTAALQLSLLASSYKDFVTIPSLTFVSDAEVVHHLGMKIRFADVDAETLCLKKQYKNCMPTNFAGRQSHSSGEVIDSCHRVGKDDLRGSKSMFCYSFYATKNMSTGQGGMIALNDYKKYKWLLMARDHGTTKGTEQRYKGKNPIYDVKFPGWRLKGDDLRASIGIEQLKKLPKINEKRRLIVNRYNKAFGLDRIGLHLYPILVEDRDKFISIMFDQGIQTSVHFRPIHTLTAYKQNIKLPVTDYIGPRIVSLPLFPQMKNKEIKYVINNVLKTNLLIK